jgi:hypothetical protein
MVSSVSKEELAPYLLLCELILRFFLDISLGFEGV